MKMHFMKTVALLCVCAGVCNAHLFQDDWEMHGKARSRTTRTTRSTWPIQCIYTSMINQDNTWMLYRPILDCCYRCRKPHHECLKNTHPWFCYREAFACSTKCIVKAYWHGKNKPRNTAQILQNYPLTSLYSKEVTSSNGNDDYYQSSPAARRPKLPCVGHSCYGELCFRTQLCFQVEQRYLKNIPAKI